MFGTPNYNYGNPWNSFGVQNTSQAVSSQPQANSISVVYIQGGEITANAYLMAPNQSVIRIDNQLGKMFIKTTDASGAPISFRVFDEVKTQPKQQTDYVTREEFDKVRGDLEKRLEGIYHVPTA